MNLFQDDHANTEMIPAVVYLFILLVSLYFVVFSISPVLQFIPALAETMDETGSIYVDIESYFDAAVRGFFLMLGLMVGSKLIHIGLLAIKKQRYTGSYNESDF